MRSPENVLESLKSKACNKSYKYERLYRNLYNPQFYLLAYQRIQAKPGNMTAGTDGKTIDGMGMARINALIEKMRDFSYQPNPARRTYIPKSNGKMRPLGIPSFDDKLIQEVVRLILESIYEPTFSDYSHGFRINRSCHTALKYVQKYFTGTKWFVEGDIKGCFDNVDHHVLIAILRKRIADEHFIGLLWKFLKAGYMEDWNYHNTYSGTPQGSIISPILANIYMNELDSYMAEYAEKFNCGNRRKINPAFKKKLDVCRGKEQRLKRNLSKMSEEEKEGLIAEIRELRRSLKSIPYSDQMDDSYKRLCYIRYADDFFSFLQSSFRFFNESGKCSLVGNGEFCKNFSVKHDVCFFKTVYESAVIDAVCFALRGNAGDPKRTEISLFKFSSDVSVLKGLHYRFVGSSVKLGLAAEISFSKFKNFLMSLAGSNRTFNSCHLSTPSVIIYKE